MNYLCIAYFNFSHLEKPKLTYEPRELKMGLEYLNKSVFRRKEIYSSTLTKCIFFF